MTLRAVALVIGTKFRESGVEAVLAGGSAATFYAPAAYQSRDIDFVLTYCDESMRAAEALLALGFEGPGPTFRHANTSLTVDIIEGPLAVGNEQIARWSQVKEGEWTINVIRPEDCVKDRLAAYYFWRDRGGLAQAIAVALVQDVDLAEVRRWSEAEGELAKYGEFEARLAQERAR